MKARFLVVLAGVGATVAAAVLVLAGPAAAVTTITVNCPSGDLQNAIDNLANAGDTIVINGTCYGNFFIDGSTTAPIPLTLQGGSPGATLNGRGTGSTLGMYLANVTIRNLTITNGYAPEGGGLFVAISSLTMTNVTVKGNSAGDQGGGGVDAGGSSLDFTGVTVTRNTALYQGGGMIVSNSQLAMTASTVSLNRTTGTLGDIDGGGGIWIGASDVLLTNTKVTSNTSAANGGGIADFGGCRAPNASPVGQGSVCAIGAGTAGGRAVGDRLAFPEGLNLVNSSVDHNTTSDEGGGIYNTSFFADSPATLQGSAVSFNTARSGDGGGVANYGVCGFTASLLVTGSVFRGNNARNGDGGAIYNASGDHVCEPGTALLTIADSGVTNARNNLNQNQAVYGGGIANEQDDGYSSTSIQGGAQITGNKATKTGGGVWNNCGSLLKSGGNVLLNTPNNIVNTCIQ